MFTFDDKTLLLLKDQCFLFRSKPLVMSKTKKASVFTMKMLFWFKTQGFVLYNKQFICPVQSPDFEPPICLRSGLALPIPCTRPGSQGVHQGIQNMICARNMFPRKHTLVQTPHERQQDTNICCFTHSFGHHMRDDKTPI